MDICEIAKLAGVSTATVPLMCQVSRTEVS